MARPTGVGRSELPRVHPESMVPTAADSPSGPRCTLSALYPFGMRWFRLAVVGVVLTAATVACGDTGSPGGTGTSDGNGNGNGDSSQLLYADPVARDGSRDADPVLDWIDLHLDLIRREVLAPPYATRMVAHTALALQVAAALADPDDTPIIINDPDTSEPLAWPDPTTFTGNPGSLDPVVAGAVAAAEVTRAFVPGSAAQRSVSVLEAQQVADRLGEGDHRRDPSVLLGLAVADTIVDRSGRDGFDRIDANPPRPEAGPGEWEPTPPDYMFALEPGWGQVAALVVDPAVCPVDDPLPWDDTPGSAFHDQAMVVFDLDAKLTPDERTVARYWNDRAGSSYTPTGHWVHILGAQLDADANGPQPPSRAAASRAYALLGVATGDSFIATWQAKYATMVMRPVTYLRETTDPDWLPFLITPNHPSYPSGHSVGSWAAAETLAATIGDRGFTDTAHQDKESWGNRSYAGFAEAATEASLSRRLGGIHYPMDTSAGDALGKCVATEVLQRAQPLPEG